VENVIFADELLSESRFAGFFDSNKKTSIK
jgi:hypothetical protein